MIIKIITCPKCLKKTLVVVATNSSVIKKCSECNFRETMSLSDYKKKKEV